MIHINRVDIKVKFDEIYTDDQDGYLWPSFYLGYMAGVLPESPNLAIPGNDAHMIVAAHNGRLSAEILKINKMSCERATGKKLSTKNNTSISIGSVSSTKRSATF